MVFLAAAAAAASLLAWNESVSMRFPPAPLVTLSPSGSLALWYFPRRRRGLCPCVWSVRGDAIVFRFLRIFERVCVMSNGGSSIYLTRIEDYFMLRLTNVCPVVEIQPAVVNIVTASIRFVQDY